MNSLCRLEVYKLPQASQKLQTQQTNDKSKFQVNFLYAPELMPTTIRPWGTAMCTLSAYVGFSIPPFITDYLVRNR